MADDFQFVDDDDFEWTSDSDFEFHERPGASNFNAKARTYNLNARARD